MKGIEQLKCWNLGSIGHKQQHLKWARSHVQWTEECKFVLLTNENRIGLYNHDRPVRVWSTI